MDTIRLLSTHRVHDLERAERWYGLLFGRGPDARPMDGLLEWRLTHEAGVQVWLDPDAAGGSGSTIAVTDLDAVTRRLDDAGIEHSGVRQATTSRILEVADPDGNRVVLTEGREGG